MSRALLLASVLSMACGVGDEPALASVSLSLSEAVADRIEELQVTLVVSSASFDCRKARSGCLVDQSVAPQPLAGEHEGLLALRVPWSRSAGAGLISLSVDPGEYLVHVEALDAGGLLLAHGCRLKIDLREGSTTSAEVTLDAWAGEACRAAR